MLIALFLYLGLAIITTRQVYMRRFIYGYKAMAPCQEEDIVSNALELISITSTWLLVRHQWLINTMRCLLTGEDAQALGDLYDFERMIPKDLKLSEQLIERFTEIRVSLEAIWEETTKASHPMLGLPIFEQLNNYQALAHQFMLASTEANQKLIHDFAMRDSLTGARTRLTLSSCLYHELNRTKRTLIPATIALIDQDKFKSINDRWGHVVGDHVIKKLAKIIQHNLRPTDKLFRFGGDEWLIVMPYTSFIEAEKAINKMKKTYADYAFKPTIHNVFYTSFTYGIAESVKHAEPEQWITEADNQLYKNKQKQ
jgi:diguanylate cyclase (GGDEF)-like protein